MVNTQKGNSQLPIAEITGFSETFLFSKITFWKKKTLTSLNNYSTILPSTEITFQNKGEVLDTVQLLDITFRVLSSKNFTTTRVYTHTSWLLKKHAAARSARGHVNVQTYYSHFGNKDIRIQGDKLQEYGGRLQ